jgi:hypothetical protein
LAPGESPGCVDGKGGEEKGLKAGSEERPSTLGVDFSKAH